MTFALVSRFHVINVKALVDAFNQENALVGAFSVIVQPVVEPMAWSPPPPGLGMVACGMVTICGVEQVEAAPPQ